MTSHDNHGKPSCNYKTRGRRRWGRRALLSLAVLLGLGGVAIAAGPQLHHPHPHHGATPEQVHAHIHGMIDHLIEKVDGSEAQRTALKAIADRAEPKMTAIHGEARDLKGEFRDLLTAEKIDRKALEAARKDAVETCPSRSTRASWSLAWRRCCGAAARRRPRRAGCCASAPSRSTATSGSCGSPATSGP